MEANTPAHRLYKRARLLDIAAFCVSIITGLALTSLFFDHFWEARDEGYFAHIAERLANGEVLHRDIQAQHPGLIHLIHGLIFRMFGEDILYLRVLPAIASLIQSILTFWILYPRGRWVAMIGSIAVVATGFIQFPNPTHHWIALALTFGALTIFLKWKNPSIRRYIALGCLAGFIFILRQPTGLFVSFAIFAVCMIESHNDQFIGKGWVAKTLMAAFGAFIFLYQFSHNDWFSMLLIATGPVLVCFILSLRLKVSDIDCLKCIGWLCGGAFIPVIPLLIYHGWHGSYLPWLNDVVFSAFNLSGMSYVGSYSYFTYFFGAPVLGMTDGTFAGLIHILFWPVLLIAPLVIGLIVARRLWFEIRPTASLKAGVIYIIYSLVSLHYADKVYYFYSVPMMLVTYLIFASDKRLRAVSLGVGLIAIISVYFHAAQPYERGRPGILVGDRVATNTPTGFDRASIRITPNEQRFFSDIITTIDAMTAEDDSILVVPGNPDFYFLSGRLNPLRYPMLGYGLVDEDTTQDTLDTLALNPPELVIYNPELGWNTPWTEQVMDVVRCHYIIDRRIDDFIFYRPLEGRPNMNPASCPTSQ